MTIPKAAPSIHVSVIIPCRDVVRYLPDAIESVLEQGVADLELIVVDDGSATPLEAFLHAHTKAAWPDLRVLRHDAPQGPAAARNTGLSEARGAFVAFLDADDVWEPGGLLRQLDRLAQRPEALFSVGATEVVGMPTASSSESRVGRVLREARVDLLLPATVFRREAFDVVGMLDPTLRFGEDSDWFFRAREQGVPYITNDERYLLYRRHDRNMTCGKDNRELFVPQTIIRSLRRRRAQGQVTALPAVPPPEDDNA